MSLMDMSLIGQNYWLLPPEVRKLYTIVYHMKDWNNMNIKSLGEQAALIDQVVLWVDGEYDECIIVKITDEVNYD